MSKPKLPAGWSESRIGDVVEDRVEHGLPEGKRDFIYIDISAVDNRRKEIVGPRKLSNSKAPSRARQQVKSGDVLVSTTRPNLNAVALVPPRLDGSVASTGFAVLRPIFLESRWLYFVVQSEDFIAEMSAMVKGALYPAIRPGQVRDYVMPVPPLAEQKRIARSLTKLLKRTQKVSETLETLPGLIQQYRATLLEAACTGRLVPSEAELAHKEGRDFEPASILLERVLVKRRGEWESDQLARMRITGKMPKDDKWKSRYKEPELPDREDVEVQPEGWASASVGQCGFVQLGRQRSPKTRSKNYPRPYIRAANITESGINVTDVLEMDFPPDEFEKFRLKAGDILLSEASGSPEQVGKPVVWAEEIENCCFQNTVIRLKPVTIGSDFLLLVLKHFYTTGAFARLAGGVGINHLGADKFSRMVVPLPPLAEQSRIVDEVKRRFAVLSRIERQIEAALAEATSLRLLLFRRALSGKLVNQNGADESASKLLLRVRRIKNQRANLPEVKAATPLRLKIEKFPMLTLEDIKPTHLAKILHKHGSPLEARDLWKESQLTIDDFYAQLKEELGRSIQETNEGRLLEVKS